MLDNSILENQERKKNTDQSRPTDGHALTRGTPTRHPVKGTASLGDFKFKMFGL